LWNDDLKDAIMRANGSVQNIDVIPQDLKELYKTVWELSMKDIIDMSRHRGYFIDQSQSLNLFLEGATMAKLTSMHFYAWKSGLKTGMYYLRTKSAVDAIKFTLKKETKEAPKPEQVAVAAAQVMEAQATKAEPETEPKQETVAPEGTALTPEELRAIIAQSKEAEGDDCLMCGS
jgi:ribonucleoside-diphosphate reductase alpha chain